MPDGRTNGPTDGPTESDLVTLSHVAHNLKSVWLQLNLFSSRAQIYWDEWKLLLSNFGPKYHRRVTLPPWVHCMATIIKSKGTPTKYWIALLKNTQKCLNFLKKVWINWSFTKLWLFYWFAQWIRIALQSKNSGIEHGRLGCWDEWQWNLQLQNQQQQQSQQQ